MSIRILLADDHKIVREGLRSLLNEQPGVEVVGEAENGRITLQMAREIRPDVVIMDITMSDLNGIEATRQIIASVPEVKVLVLSVHSDRRFVLEALRAGASGFLSKDCSSEELAHAVSAVAANRIYLAPEVAGVVIEDYIHRVLPSGSSESSTLTGREREVLQLIAEGWPTKEIASRLYVSTKTVEAHRQKIMDKLGIRSIAELTKFAIREGLTSIDS